MTLKEKLLANLERERAALQAKLDALPRQQRFISALPEQLDDLCEKHSVRIAVGADWLRDANLSCKTHRVEAVHELVELLPPIPLALFQDSTVCFAPLERASEVIRDRAGYTVTPRHPVVFEADALGDGFFWWTSIDGLLTKVTVTHESRFSRFARNSWDPVTRVASWTVSHLPAGTLLVTGNAGEHSPGNVYVHWDEGANLQDALSKTQYVNQRTV